MFARATVVAVLLWASLGHAQTFSYQISTEIRYDVVVGGVTYPDTPVWGLPAGVVGYNGTIDLTIDAAGNVSGSTPVDPGTGLGILRGERLINIYNPILGLTDGAWGTPVGKVAPISAGTVHLGNTFLGDFAGMSTVVSGFIEDGNSGDFFNLSNGVGLDGKMEFTFAGSDGMSITFTSVGTSIGAGTGWYLFALDTGDISYMNGTDFAIVNLTGVIPIDVWIDATAETFFIPDQLLLNNFPALSGEYGRRIDTFEGVIDASGNFTGTAHFAGIDFVSLTGSTSAGTFTDGNSTGFDLSNGLVSDDTFSVVMTDSTGLIDLVIDGALGRDFTRGNCNADIQFDVSDPIYLLGYLFASGPTPVCMDSCDANDNGQLNLGDVVYTLSVLFGPTLPPIPPYPSCGSDPTPDTLGCLEFPPCP